MMRELSLVECAQVTGTEGNSEAIVMGVGLLGGIASATIASYCSPLITFFSTVGGAATGAIICTPVAPGIGSIICGFGGGLFGYGFGAHMTTVSAFLVGGIASAYGFSQL